jgi:outer membrane protein
LGNYRIARAVLAAAVGSPEPELDVDDANETLSPIPSWQEVEGHALRYEPEMQIARDRVQAQRAHTLAIRAKTRPNVFATASLSGRAGGAPASNGIEPAANGFLPTIPNYDVGVILAWPLYDPTVEAAYKASQQREWAFDAELAASQQRTRTIAQQVYRRVQVAQAALLALAKATEAARSNYDQAEARFRAGMGTSTELADAEALRLDAEVQEAVGGFELATARAQLSRSMGE